MSEYGAYLLKKMCKTAELTAKEKVISEQQGLIDVLVEQRDLYKEIADAAITKLQEK